MVKLIVDDFEQMTLLEWFLQVYSIEYLREINDIQNGITTPYLVVNGVPLDFERSMKWIEELQNK